MTDVTDTDDLRRHRLQEAVDSTATKTWARYVWPIATIVIGFLVVDKLRSIEANQITQSKRDEIYVTRLAGVETNLALLNVRFNEGALGQIKDNRDAIKQNRDDISALKSDVDVIRRVVKIP